MNRILTQTTILVGIWGDIIVSPRIVAIFIVMKLSEDSRYQGEVISYVSSVEGEREVLVL